MGKFGYPKTRSSAGVTADTGKVLGSVYLGNRPVSHSRLDLSHCEVRDTPHTMAWDLGQSAAIVDNLSRDPLFPFSTIWIRYTSGWKAAPVLSYFRLVYRQRRFRDDFAQAYFDRGFLYVVDKHDTNHSSTQQLVVNSKCLEWWRLLYAGATHRGTSAFSTP